MKSPTPNDITATLNAIEVSELPEDHPRRLVKKAVAQYRRRTAIDPDYDFNAAPREARAVIYSTTVKYSAQHSWWRG